MLLGMARLSWLCGVFTVPPELERFETELTVIEERSMLIPVSAVRDGQAELVCVYGVFTVPPQIERGSDTELTVVEERPLLIPVSAVRDGQAELACVNVVFTVPPQIQRGSDTELTVVEERPVLIRCRVVGGQPAPVVRWIKDNIIISPHDVHYRILRSHTLAIPVVRYHIVIIGGVLAGLG